MVFELMSDYAELKGWIVVAAKGKEILNRATELFSQALQISYKNVTAACMSCCMTMKDLSYKSWGNYNCAALHKEALSFY